MTVEGQVNKNERKADRKRECPTVSPRWDVL